MEDVENISEAIYKCRQPLEIGFYTRIRKSNDSQIPRICFIHIESQKSDMAEWGGVEKKLYNRWKNSKDDGMFHEPTHVIWDKAEVSPNFFGRAALTHLWATAKDPSEQTPPHNSVIDEYFSFLLDKNISTIPWEISI